MADDEKLRDVHAPVEDTVTPLGIKLLVVGLLVILLAEAAAIVLMLTQEGLILLPL